MWWTNTVKTSSANHHLWHHGPPKAVLPMWPGDGFAIARQPCPIKTGSRTAGINLKRLLHAPFTAKEAKNGEKSLEEKEAAGR